MGTEHPCPQNELLAPLLAGSQKSCSCDDRTQGGSQLGLTHTCAFICSRGWSQPGQGMLAGRMLNNVLGVPTSAFAAGTSLLAGPARKPAEILP